MPTLSGTSYFASCSLRPPHALLPSADGRDGERAELASGTQAQNEPTVCPQRIDKGRASGSACFLPVQQANTVAACAGLAAWQCVPTARQGEGDFGEGFGSRSWSWAWFARSGLGERSHFLALLCAGGGLACSWLLPTQPLLLSRRKAESKSRNPVRGCHAPLRQRGDGKTPLEGKS